MRSQGKTTASRPRRASHTGDPFYRWFHKFVNGLARGDKPEKLDATAEQNIRELERKIKRTEGVQQDLYVLETAGMNPKVLLRCLAAAALPVGVEAKFKAAMRRKAEELRNLADQFDTVARRGMLTALDPLSYAETWSSFFRLELPSKRAPEPDRLLLELHHRAEAIRAEANKLGRLLRSPDSKVAEFGVLMVLFFVEASTNGKPHDQQLARLLNDAFEAVGREKIFSAGSLATMRSRLRSRRGLSRPTAS